jgi:hypothetical protein
LACNQVHPLPRKALIDESPLQHILKIYVHLFFKHNLKHIDYNCVLLTK